MGQNKQNKLLDLLGIRVGCFTYIDKNGKPSGWQSETGYCRTKEAYIIGYLVYRISDEYVKFLYGRLKFLNTDIINCPVVDSDSKEKDIGIIYKRKLGGPESYMHFGSNYILLSRSKYHSLSDIERTNYLNECVLDSLVEFFKVTKTDGVELVKECYEKIKQGDKYFNYKKELVNKIGSHSAIIQIKSDYDYYYYRLEVKNLIENKVNYYEIDIKPNTDLLNHDWDFKSGEELVTTYFSKIRWKNNYTFCFEWERNQKYEFSVETMNLTLNKTIISN